MQSNIALEIVGTYDENRKLNSIVFDLEFSDGQVKDRVANLIDKNILTRFDSITYFTHTDRLNCIFEEMEMLDKNFVTYNSQRRLSKTTLGLKLQAL